MKIGKCYTEKQKGFRIISSKKGFIVQVENCNAESNLAGILIIILCWGKQLNDKFQFNHKKNHLRKKICKIEKLWRENICKLNVQELYGLYINITIATSK